MLFLVVIALGVIYFLPVAVAAGTHHPHKVWIFVITLLTGWTIAGWLSALIWAYAPHGLVNRVAEEPPAA